MNDLAIGLASLIRSKSVERRSVTIAGASTHFPEAAPIFEGLTNKEAHEYLAQRKTFEDKLRTESRLHHLATLLSAKP